MKCEKVLGYRGGCVKEAAERKNYLNTINDWKKVWRIFPSTRSIIIIIIVN